MSVIEAKLIKQIEYYFGDLNLVKDKHLKQLILNSTDGFVSFDELLKFPRLSNISQDKELIKSAIKNSSSLIVEASDDGIRRNPELVLPENIQEAADKYLDKSVYVKGFSQKELIDSIIEYLEKHGGPTINVHMRRLPKDKIFKGSVFAVFQNVEDAEKFINNEEASKFNGCEMIRTWQKDYTASKKSEQEERHREKEQRQKEAIASKEALLQAKMTCGALLELSMVEKSELSPEIPKGDFTENTDERTATKTLKTWLSSALEEIAPVAWVEFFPLTNKIIVRMGKENSAETALKTLCESEHGNTDKTAFSYQTYEMSGVVLADEKEKDYWRNILSEQGTKRKRNDHKHAGGPNRKKFRR